jgi:hypothetical protein
MAKNNQKVEHRGGKRAGAGRPVETLSASQVAEFARAAKEMAKKRGKTLQEIVLGFAYDEKAPTKDRLAASKLYWDKSVINVVEGGEADKDNGPAVYLPEQRPVLKAV